jgi:hypothetical protein
MLNRLSRCWECNAIIRVGVICEECYPKALEQQVIELTTENKALKMQCEHELANGDCIYCEKHYTAIIAELQTRNEELEELWRRCNYYMQRGGQLPPMIASLIDEGRSPRGAIPNIPTA